VAGIAIHTAFFSDLRIYRISDLGDALGNTFWFKVTNGKHVYSVEHTNSHTMIVTLVNLFKRVVIVWCD